jgi:hypothetical protein
VPQPIFDSSRPSVLVGSFPDLLRAHSEDGMLGSHSDYIASLAAGAIVSIPGPGAGDQPAMVRTLSDPRTFVGASLDETETPLKDGDTDGCSLINAAVHSGRCTVTPIWARRGLLGESDSPLATTDAYGAHSTPYLVLNGPPGVDQETWHVTLEGSNASTDAARRGWDYHGPMRVGTLSGDGGDTGDALGDAGADMPGAP